MILKKYDRREIITKSAVPVNGARKHQQMKLTSNRALAYKNTDAGLIHFTKCQVVI